MWSRYVMSQVKHNSYFMVGMAVGLWVALALVPLDEETAGVCVPPPPAAAVVDEYEPRREDKPLGSGGAPAPAGRSVQRPRYYSTELGMRGSLLTGVLSSEAALQTQVPALNRTLARLQPALKFFITASAMSSVPGLANVVGFTDTREMLKPFHALKYLADNYLEEYDFFFLVTDTAFIHARRLAELVSKLSVSQDVYMGEVSPGSEYCSLEAGVLLSNSVLRAVHAELEWCVRNSYSPHHHENLGRCVLHAAHVPCATAVQGETYSSIVVQREDGSDALVPELSRCVTARPVTARALPALHAFTARLALERGAAEAQRAAWSVRRGTLRHPQGYRNLTWPAGTRSDPGLAPPTPDNRFSHLRWTLFNATHAFMPDELRTVAPHDAAHTKALQLVMEEVSAWCGRVWSARDVQLVEGARLWEPPTALRYRLQLRLTAFDPTSPQAVSYKQVEVARALGGARLVPVRYVTESARLALILPVTQSGTQDALAFLARYELQQDKNTQLYVVCVGSEAEPSCPAALTTAVAALAVRHNASTVQLLSAGGAAPAPAPERVALGAAGRAALAATARLTRDALLLLLPPHVDFNQDFLNRARMNTIAGLSWFLPVPFSRHSQYAHPAFRATTGTGRFAHTPRASILAVYRQDLAAALESWTGPADADTEAVLAASSLRCVRAPEPGAVLQPRPPPCGLPPAPASAGGEGQAQCLKQLEAEHFASLDLGARNSLAQLLLETAAAAS